MDQHVAYMFIVHQASLSHRSSTCYVTNYLYAGGFWEATDNNVGGTVVTQNMSRFIMYASVLLSAYYVLLVQILPIIAYLSSCRSII